MSHTYLKQEKEGKKLKIKYYIKGSNGSYDKEKLCLELKSALPDSEVEISAEGEILEITLSPEREADARRETVRILSENEIAYASADKDEIYILNEGKQRRVSLLAAITAVVVAIVLSVLTTFAICNATKENALPQYVVLDTPEYFENLVKLDNFFKKHSFEGYDEGKMAEAILDAYVVATGDLYAEYLNAEEYVAFFEERSGEFVGIGVSIVNNEIVIDGNTYKVMEIISVFKGSPAIENGVTVGDYIMYVEHEDEMTLVDTIGYTKALDSMLGETDSLAKFVVYRPTGSDYEEIEFSIPRRRVESESVTYKVSETDKNVGIISITGFDLTTPTQFKEAVNKLRDVHKVKYFVFDLRNNPGGSLDSIETVLTYFLNAGDEIVSTEYADGSKDSSIARAKRYESKYSGYDVAQSEIGMYKDLDFIVLTNGNTASAAELFTATMRDYGLARIVGKTTYGKGCMQTLYPLDSMGIEGGLKLTVAMYYSASKTVYHGTGIVPDYEIDLSDEAKKINFFILPEEKDAQLQKAIELLTK